MKFMVRADSRKPGGRLHHDPPRNTATDAIAPKTISSDEDERLDRALEDLVENQWVNDFVEHLNYTIEDIVGKMK